MHTWCMHRMINRRLDKLTYRDTFATWLSLQIFQSSRIQSYVLVASLLSRSSILRALGVVIWPLWPRWLSQLHSLLQKCCVRKQLHSCPANMNCLRPPQRAVCWSRTMRPTGLCWLSPKQWGDWRLQGLAHLGWPFLWDFFRFISKNRSFFDRLTRFNGFIWFVLE